MEEGGEEEEMCNIQMPLSLQALETRPYLRLSLPHWPSNFLESRWSGGGESTIKGVTGSLLPSILFGDFKNGRKT